LSLPSHSVVEEILWVNWFIQVTTCFSNYFWLLYLLVPGYGIYNYGPWILGMLFPSRPQMQVEEPTEKKQKIKYKKHP
jgi:hypothetical protein